MEGNAISSSLGPWSTSELEETVRANARIGVDQGLADDVRFKSGVAKLLRRRAAGTPRDDPLEPAIFLLRGTPPDAALAAGAKREPLLDNGRSPLNGRAWFVNPATVSGHYLPCAAADDDEMFRWIVESLGLGSTQAIIFDPRAVVLELRYYPHGLGCPDDCELVPLGDAEMTIDRIVAAIEPIYRKNLITSEAQSEMGKLWENSDKAWPTSKAEKIVQLYIRAGLTSRFPTCDIREEQPGPEGRYDIGIEREDPLEPGRITVFAILELKVLRSCSQSGNVAGYSANDVLDWVRSGVQQAAAYREGRHAKYGALCCFDMQQNPSGEVCFDHVRRLAADLAVVLKCWILYPTSAAWRSATYQAQG